MAPVMDKAAHDASSKALTTVEMDLSDLSCPIYIGTSLLDRPGLLQR